MAVSDYDFIELSIKVRVLEKKVHELEKKQKSWYEQTKHYIKKNLGTIKRWW